MCLLRRPPRRVRAPPDLHPLHAGSGLGRPRRQCRDVTDHVPDLASYDVLLVNTSAGKDSQAALDVVVTGADRAGVRDRIVVVHCDLGDMEWPGTPALAAAHAAHYGLRFEVVRRDGEDLLAHVERRGRWPDAARRYCTSDHKRAPVLRLMTALVRERHNGRPVRILNVLGLRAEESSARARRPALASNARASNSRRIVDDWLPLHEWTTAQVWARVRATGLPHHPAYDAGMPRLSCRFCVLASRTALVRSAQLNPDLAQRYADVEVRIGHRFRADLSMAQIIAEAATAPPCVAVTTWSA